MVKPSLRTRSMGTKVSEEGYAQSERAAQMAARTLGEWCRELMLTSANGQPAKATRTADEFHVLMAEVVALRAILLNVLFKQANAEPLRAEGMQRLIERADSGKLREARERLEQESGHDDYVCQ
jgi:hypothetical protein